MIKLRAVIYNWHFKFDFVADSYKLIHIIATGAFSLHGELDGPSLRPLPVHEALQQDVGRCDVARGWHENVSWD